MNMQFTQQNNEGLIRQYIAHQQTLPYQAVTPALSEPVITTLPFNLSDTYQSQALPEALDQTPLPIQNTKKSQRLRIVAIVLVGILALSIYFVWQASSPSLTEPMNTTQQHFTAPTTSALKTVATVSSLPTSSKIQVYIVGAVKKPGVYTLEVNARIYQLLQAAGGPLPEANLVALNLAARLNDGQEIYVMRVGEIPSSSTSSTPSTNTTTTTEGTNTSQININTAGADELRKDLHISTANAQAIIGYRVQHGRFSNVEELLQVVSQATYKKIKDQVKLA